LSRHPQQTDERPDGIVLDVAPSPPVRTPRIDPDFYTTRLTRNAFLLAVIALLLIAWAL
jgi:hypothetical protein